jgi:hypothetical protein
MILRPSCLIKMKSNFNNINSYQHLSEERHGITFAQPMEIQLSRRLKYIALLTHFGEANVIYAVLVKSPDLCPEHQKCEHNAGMHKFYKKRRTQFKIHGAKSVTRRKFRTRSRHTKLAAWATWCP